ncbi:MAG: GNAT family N-acetyltransferase [Thermoproteota archaeon]
MRFAVGCEMGKFREYYEKARGTLNPTEEGIVSQDPAHLIVFEDGGSILGHAIWHESDTEEHRKGVPRDRKDRELRRKLLGGRRDFVELHELWLKEEHRGKGYGKRFFEFFEDFARKRGHGAVVYYANDPAALAICRRRGYKEAYGVEEGGETYYVLCLSLDG